MGKRWSRLPLTPCALAPALIAAFVACSGGQAEVCPKTTETATLLAWLSTSRTATDKLRPDMDTPTARRPTLSSLRDFGRNGQAGPGAF